MALRMPEAILALIVLLMNRACWSLAAAGAHTTSEEGFVRVDGLQLRIGDQPFFFQGTNLHYLGPAGQDVLTESQVDYMLRWYRDTGLKVVRFWTFGNAWTDYDMDALGNIVLNAKSLRRLDFILARAAAYKLKLITAFVNYEPDYTGITDWVERILGPSFPKETFYVSDKAMDYGVPSLPDPVLSALADDMSTQTFAAREVMNEPHTSDGFQWQSLNSSFAPTSCFIAGDGDANGQGRAVACWICQAAAFIKSIDSNHMVSSGEEGYRVNGLVDPMHAWINDGTKGVDFALDAQCTYLDFMTMHIYPDNWQISYDTFMPIIEQHMADRAALAAAHGKPIIVEEYGCCQAPDYMGHRGVVFDHLNNMVQKYGYAGQLVWQFNAWAPDLEKYYDFGCYDQEAVGEYLSNANLMNFKSGYFWDILRDGSRNGTVDNGYMNSDINCWVADPATRLVKCYDSYAPWNPPAMMAATASTNPFNRSNATSSGRRAGRRLLRLK